MSSAKRTYIENNRGERKAEWVKVGDDHYRHADALNWVAYEIGRGSYSDIAMSAPMNNNKLHVSENLFKESDFLYPAGFS